MVAFDPDAASAALSVFRRRFSFVASYGEREMGSGDKRTTKRTFHFGGNFGHLHRKLEERAGGLWIVGVWVNTGVG